MIEFDNEIQNYLYRVGEKLLKELEQTYSKRSIKKNRILEETLDRINARQLKPRLTQDELDEVLVALGVPLNIGYVKEKPGDDYVNIVEFAKKYKYQPASLLKAFSQKGIEKIKYKRYAYVKREDLEKYLFGRANINIDEYIKASEFLRKYKINKSTFYIYIKKVDFGDNILHGKKCYVKKSGADMIAEEIRKRVENEKSVRNRTEMMRNEGYIGIINLTKIFEASLYLVRTMMDIWDIPAKIAYDRFVYYHVDSIIKKVKEVKGNEKEPWKNTWIVRKVIENREKFVDRLEKFKNGKIFKKNKSGGMMTDKITDK
jgi:hypothetical protein